MKFTRPVIIRWLILIALTYAVLHVLATMTDTELYSLGRLPLSTFLVTLALSLAFFPLSAARWHAILSGVGIHVPYIRILRIVLAAGPLALLPGRLGDFGRVLGLPAGTPAHVAFGSVLVEKDIDICVLLMFSCIGFGLMGNTAAAVFCGAALCFLVVLSLTGGALLTRAVPGRFRPLARDVSEAVYKLRQRPWTLSRAIVSSAANWALSFMQTALVLHALSGQWHISAIVAYLPLAIFIGLIPLTIAGVGSRDAAFTALMAGVAPAGALVTTAAWYSLLSYGVAFALGLPFLRILWQRLPAERKEIIAN